MKKKLLVIASFLMLTAFCFGFVGCNNHSIAFKIEETTVNTIAFDRDNIYPIQVVNCIKDLEELNRFFEDAYFTDSNIEFKLNFYDEAYFSKNALLFFTATSDRKYDATITNVKIKNRELFVTLTRTENGNESEYFYFQSFITVAKSDIEKVTKFSYMIVNK